MDGPELITAAQELVVSALRNVPEGLTNAEVERRTRLNLPVTRQKNYITYTILQYFVEQGRVRKDGTRGVPGEPSVQIAS